MKALGEFHSGYPVLNTAGRLVGLIPTHMLVCLARNKIFYDKQLIISKPISGDISGHIEFEQVLEVEDEDNDISPIDPRPTKSRQLSNSKTQDVDTATKLKEEKGVEFTVEKIDYDTPGADPYNVSTGSHRNYNS